jgi:hypothetical protein
MTIRAVPTTPLAILFIASCRFMLAQTPPTILLVDVENLVQYQADTPDVSKFATNPDPTPSVNFREFSVATVLGDIVAVNGRPAKGLYASRARAIATSPSAKPGDGQFGQAFGDVQRAAIREEVMEILNTDGTPIGSVMTLGLSGGAPPPGAPAAQTGANFAIVGGTGAFVGVRGTSGAAQGPRNTPGRAASMAEDPANRRINGGGIIRRVLTLFPMSVPQILDVSHAGDSTAVSAANPAKGEEILSLSGTGLGPCAKVDPGEPFPQNPAARVNSPLEVTVNGKTAEVISAVGSPGAVDRYQVKFRVPSGTENGTATIQVTAAWIASTPVSIAVQ